MKEAGSALGYLAYGFRFWPQVARAVLHTVDT